MHVPGPMKSDPSMLSLDRGSVRGWTLENEPADGGSCARLLAFEAMWHCFVCTKNPFRQPLFLLPLFVRRRARTPRSPDRTARAPGEVRPEDSPPEKRDDEDCEAAAALAATDWPWTCRTSLLLRPPPPGRRLCRLLRAATSASPLAAGGRGGPVVVAGVCGVAQ